MFDEDFWAGFGIGFVVGFVSLILIAIAFTPSDVRIAEMECDAFEEIYGYHFEPADKECIFEYGDVNIPVEWDNIDSHKAIIYILE